MQVAVGQISCVTTYNRSSIWCIHQSRNTILIRYKMGQLPRKKRSCCSSRRLCPGVSTSVDRSGLKRGASNAITDKQAAQKLQRHFFSRQLFDGQYFLHLVHFLGVFCDRGCPCVGQNSPDAIATFAQIRNAMSNWIVTLTVCQARNNINHFLFASTEAAWVRGLLIPLNKSWGVRKRLHCFF